MGIQNINDQQMVTVLGHETLDDINDSLIEHAIDENTEQGECLKFSVFDLRRNKVIGYAAIELLQGRWECHHWTLENKPLFDVFKLDSFYKGEYGLLSEVEKQQE